jgi:hypothetical protein
LPQTSQTAATGNHSPEKIVADRRFEDARTEVRRGV